MKISGSTKISAIIITLAIFLNGCSFMSKEKTGVQGDSTIKDGSVAKSIDDSAIPKIKTLKLTEKETFEMLSYIGTAKAGEEINITSRAEGIVQNIYVRPGDIVGKDDILFDLKDPAGQNNLQIGFEVINNNYQNAKVAYNNIRNKNEELLKASELALEVSKTNLANTKETLNKTSIQNNFLIETTTKQLENAKKNIERVKQTVNLTEQRLGLNDKNVTDLANISLDNTYRYLEISLFATLPSIITTIKNTTVLPSGISSIENDLEDIQDDFDDTDNNDISGLKNLIEDTQDLITDLLDYLNDDSVRTGLGANYSAIKISLDTLVAQLQGQNSSVTNTENTLKSLGLNGQSQLQPITQQFESLNDQISILELALESSKNQTAISEHSLKSSIELLNKDVEGKTIALNLTKITTRMEIDQTETQLKNLELQLKQAKMQVGYLEVKAGVDGIISKLNIEKGQLVYPNTPLASIFSADKNSIEIYVNPSDISKIKIGEKVELTDKSNSQKYLGQVHEIDPKATPDNRLILVKIALDSKSESIIPNTIFDTKIIVGIEESDIYIPISAILVREDGNFIFRVEKEIAKISKIELGQIEGSEILVKSGLKIGDTIVTEGQSKLEDGKKVEILLESREKEASNKFESINT